MERERERERITAYSNITSSFYHLRATVTVRLSDNLFFILTLTALKKNNKKQIYLEL